MKVQYGYWRSHGTRQRETFEAEGLTRSGEGTRQVEKKSWKRRTLEAEGQTRSEDR